MNAHRKPVRVAARVTTRRDVGEHSRIRIDEGVQESHHGLARREKFCIEQCDGAGKDG